MLLGAQGRRGGADEVRAQIAVIVTDYELEPLDEGIELIVKTEKDVLDKMNEWYVCVCAQDGRQADETQVHQPAWEGAFASSASSEMRM